MLCIAVIDMLQMINITVNISVFGHVLWFYWNIQTKHSPTFMDACCVFNNKKTQWPICHTSRQFLWSAH